MPRNVLRYKVCAISRVLNRSDPERIAYLRLCPLPDLPLPPNLFQSALILRHRYPACSISPPSSTFSLTSASTRSTLTSLTKSKNRYWRLISSRISETLRPYVLVAHIR